MADGLEQALLHYGVEVTRARQKIRCPIHQETRPSCTVDIEQGWFKCHGCDAKGDAIELIKGMEKCDFTTAARILASIVGDEGVNVRVADEPRRRTVPAGEGYRPSYRRAVPAGGRRRTGVG